MKIKIKLGELETILRGINILGCKGLPVKVGYALSKNKRAIIDEYERFNEQRIKILESECLKDEKGLPITLDNQYTYVDEDIKSEAIQKVKDLCSIETEIELMGIAISELESCGTGKYDVLTGSDMEILLLMIE